MLDRYIARILPAIKFWIISPICNYINDVLSAEYPWYYLAIMFNLSISPIIIPLLITIGSIQVMLDIIYGRTHVRPTPVYFFYVHDNRSVISSIPSNKGG